jgi:hypothetical protein
METAMQQHIEWLKATLDLCKENAPTLVNCISLCISDAESRLEMEKEQIIKHSIELAKILISNPIEVSGKTPQELINKYYNETFKTE